MTRMPQPLDVATRQRLHARRTTPPPGSPDPRHVVVAAGVLALQVAVLVIAEMLRPEAVAVAPDALWDAIGGTLVFVYLTALVVALAALRTPGTSLRASGVAAGAAVLLTLGCPVSGHHTLGAWFVTELALVGAAAGVALRAQLRTR